MLAQCSQLLQRSAAKASALTAQPADADPGGTQRSFLLTLKPLIAALQLYILVCQHSQPLAYDAHRSLLSPVPTELAMPMPLLRTTLNDTDIQHHT